MRARLARWIAPVAALLLAMVVATDAEARTRAALPRPTAAQGSLIARLFEQLDRDTTWKLVGQVRLQADTWHTEGIVKLGNRWIVSSVQGTVPTVKDPNGQTVTGTDRTPGECFGHLMRSDSTRRLLAHRVLNRAGALEYRPGGLDYDGRRLWVTLAQYRPHPTSTFLRVNPTTLRPRAVLRAHDHFGGVVHDTARHRLFPLQWGSPGAERRGVPPRT